MNTLCEVVEHDEIRLVPLHELQRGDVVRGVDEESVVYAVHARQAHWHVSLYRWFGLRVPNPAQYVRYADEWHAVSSLVPTPTVEFCAWMGDLELSEGYSCIADGVGVAVQNVHRKRDVFF